MSAINSVAQATDRVLSRHGLPGKVRKMKHEKDFATSKTISTVVVGPLDCQSCVTDTTRWVDGVSRSIRVGLISLPPGTDFSGSGWELQEAGRWLRITEIKVAGVGYICDLEGGGL